MPKKEQTPKIQVLTWTERLMRDVRAFQAKTGMKFTTIGAKSIQNPRMWNRMETGGTITLAKADQLYKWMAKQGHRFNR